MQSSSNHLTQSYAHEAWHVVQQKQGRVKPTTQVSGVNVNDNKHLEREADVMGAKALKSNTQSGGKKPVAGKSKPAAKSGKGAVQRKTRNLKKDVPSEVIKPEILKSVDAADAINIMIDKYNKISKTDTDYRNQLDILNEIILYLENMKLAEPKADDKSEKGTAQKMDINRGVAQLARNNNKKKKTTGSSSTGKRSSGSSNKKETNTKGSKSKAKGKESKKTTSKPPKPPYSPKKFKTIKRKIQADVAMETEAVNEQLLAIALEERNRELDKSAPEGEKKSPEQSAGGKNNAEEQARVNEQTEAGPEAEALKNNKTQQETAQKEQNAQEQAGKDNEKESGQAGTAPAATEQVKGKGKAQKANGQSELTAMNSREKQTNKEGEQAERQEAEKPKPEVKKVNTNNSPQAQAQQGAMNKANSAGKKESAKNKKQKELKEKLKKKKEAKEKKEELKKKLKEQPAFDKIKAMANQGKMKLVLEQYGLNWFTAKEHLTTLKYATDKKEYKQRLNVMKKLLVYRDKNITPILKDMLKKEGDYLLSTRFNSKVDGASCKSVTVKKGKFGYDAVAGGKKIIQSIAPGSTSVTSDIDITFSAPENEDYEVKLVQNFNNKFRGNWSVSSGIVFDVNAYSAGFLSMAAGKRTADEKEGEKDPEYKKALGEQYRNAMDSMNTTQMALGLLPVRQYFGDDFDGWRGFYKNVEKKLAGEVKPLMKSKTVSQHIVNKIVDNLEGVFQSAANLYNETEKELKESKVTEKDSSEKSGKKLDQKHIDALASDKLYEKQLEKVRKLLTERQFLMRKINMLMKDDSKEGVYNLKTLREKLSNNMQRFDVEQGKALVYANEAYYNAGSAVHVVEGMQKGKDIKLGREGEMQTLLMNIGYKLQHYSHQEEKDGHGSAMVNTSKYGQRIEDALKRGKRLEKQSDEDYIALKNETDLLKNNKKLKSVTMPANNIHLAEQEKGTKVTKESVHSVNLNVAMNELVSYYIYSLKKVQKEAEQNNEMTKNK